MHIYTEFPLTDKQYDDTLGINLHWNIIWSAIYPITEPANTPLYRGCDLCASLLRPQNWPGRRWRHKGGRKVASVVQWLYRGSSNLAMVAVKF